MAIGAQRTETIDGITFAFGDGGYDGVNNKVGLVYQVLNQTTQSRNQLLVEQQFDPTISETPYLVTNPASAYYAAIFTDPANYTKLIGYTVGIIKNDSVRLLLLTLATVTIS